MSDSSTLRSEKVWTSPDSVMRGSGFSDLYLVRTTVKDDCTTDCVPIFGKSLDSYLRFCRYCRYCYDGVQFHKFSGVVPISKLCCRKWIYLGRVTFCYPTPHDTTSSFPLISIKTFSDVPTPNVRYKSTSAGPRWEWRGSGSLVQEDSVKSVLVYRWHVVLLPCFPLSRSELSRIICV